MTTKKIAVIDLGTNTFNLLVAEINNRQVKRLLNTKEGVALGMGGINKNILSPEAIHRAMISLRNFNSLAKEFHCDNVVAFGTSALRNATNAHELIDLAKQELNLHIQVISGLREAELIYKGVQCGYDFSVPSLIMDIGGGSTEFILADVNGIQVAKSFEIGVSRIYQMFEFSDPLSAEDCQKIISYLEQTTENFFNTIQCKRLVGASGSFETFYKLAHDTGCPEEEFLLMNKQDLMRSLDLIIKSTQAERDLNDLIIPIRKKMAPIAAVKTKWIVDKLNIEELLISPYALKEGVMSEL
ncbi:MAG: hypothetical protein IPM74_04745 [Crocinitomicaceae bacterium]|nr:hypothetical protein [Crocinitomicaceae bacterium]MBK8925213.1 hypothetical protein [Crocinitomicaceae bacterium]